MKSPIISEIGARVAKRLGEEARKFEGKTVLITGANGFLGQYFLEAFIHLNKSVLKASQKKIPKISESVKPVIHLLGSIGFPWQKHAMSQPPV